MIREQLIAIGIFFLAGLLTLPVLLKRAALKPPQQDRIDQNRIDQNRIDKVSFILLVGLALLAFAIYLFSGLLIQPVVMVLVECLLVPRIPSGLDDVHIEAIAQGVNVLVIALVLGFFARIQSKGVRAAIWGERASRSRTQLLLKGVGLCLLIYPLVMCLTQLVQLVVGIYAPHAPFEPQTALAQLKDMRADPVLFWSFALLVVTCIPFLEELLFRGFLQAMTVWLLGPTWGVCTTAFVFGLFHYSSLQGASNYSILIGLFFFAYVLGIARLRYRSLWVPVGMHAFFNVLGLSILVLTS